jgi:catechol 2,3-dioxygenase-like lactoylglutathione lyase family enzyme
MLRGGIVMLTVSDVGRAVRFYVETLGMKLVEETADGSSVIDAGNGFLIGLRKGDAPAVVPSLLLHAKVPLDEAVAIYENRGVSFTRQGEGASFRDPDGNLFTIVVSAVPAPTT